MRKLLLLCALILSASVSYSQFNVKTENAYNTHWRIFNAVSDTLIGGQKMLVAVAITKPIAAGTVTIYQKASATVDTIAVFLVPATAADPIYVPLNIRLTYDSLFVVQTGALQQSTIIYRTGY
jgi:hypothetical protein